MSPPTLLVVAKAPVAGQAKTRLAANLGYEEAARLAAACLLDTIEVVTSLGCPVVVAMTGDLRQAQRGEEIEAALRPHRVIPQRGDDLAARLVAAHADADKGSGVVQVGMDTPHLEADVLRAAGETLKDHDAALGLAEDGGWWVLAVRTSELARCLADVPMSTDDTGAATETALVSAGATIARVAPMRDVDTWEDALQVARQAPDTRFATEMQRVVAASGRDAIVRGGSPR